MKSYNECIEFLIDSLKNDLTPITNYLDISSPHQNVLWHKTLKPALFVPANWYLTETIRPMKGHFPEDHPHFHFLHSGESVFRYYENEIWLDELCECNATLVEDYGEFELLEFQSKI